MARRNRFRLPAAAAVVVVLGGAGATYAVAGADDAPRYRTVAATTSDVEQTLSASGVVDAAARADLGFGTDGTVAKVRVGLGETVKAGQVLATLDTTELDAAVTEAEASVAQAVAQLAADRTAQSSAVVDASDRSSAPSGNPGSDQPTDDGSFSAANAALLKKLRQLQEAVIGAQGTASKALAAARSALATQVEVCAATAQAPTDSADATDSAPPTDGATETPTTPADDACAVALAEVADRQQDVSAAQDALATALENLAGLLTQALGSVSGSGPTAATPTTAKAAVTPPDSGSDSSGSGSTSVGTTITAARLASDQAQIEQARADLVAAQQERSQAALRSTRAGRVVALDVAAGDVASAGTTVVTVVGGKAVTVVGTATESQLGQLEIGQAVRVTVPGSTSAAAGRLTAIGLVADSSSGTTSYPFTVTVDDPTIALPTGSRALLQVVLSTATGVVTVPTSAVTRTGDRAVVRVMTGGTVTRTDVTLGAVGTRTVEIADGLAAGQEVVLAAMDDPITGADSELDQRGGLGGPGGTFQFRAPPGGAGGGPRTFTSGG